MNKKELQNRTKIFSRRCIKLCQSLPNNILGRHLCDQLIRCATSVSANYRAACIAQSVASFIAKLSIVIEEVDESLFWLELIADEHIFSENKILPLLQEAKELSAIFIAARKTKSQGTKRQEAEKINNKS